MLDFLSVSKRFPGAIFPALDDVSFSVGKGRICGLLGHNGAGKSTSLGVLLGMIHPDAGEAIIGGISVQREREQAIRKVGSIFEAPAFYNYLSGLHNLKVLAAYSGGVPEAKMREIIAWVGLEKRIRDRVSTYSHGMRQRLALAQALLPEPELLILDEPTDGLDPEGIVEFRRQILELRDRLGLTVLLSSHLLTEVEQVCDEVVILQGGKKVYEGDLTGCANGRAWYRIDSENEARTKELCLEMGGEWISGRASFPVGRTPSDLLSELVEKGAKVSHFSAENGSLETLYLQFSSSTGTKTGDLS
ncbi:MAG: ABC transporter ATP-binding protein [Verrucomicrobiales bacterium]|jgi:ABC-2 type transport system ATP-binding protein|nr:ABC transporter ATP-binding protein [Verrucomicrobiales bacterium]HQZ26782.1 ABC transporter ATP-binding protein [Verrucomicrobiales bacterium]